MKILLYFIVLFPLLATAQDIPASGFDKIRIADQDKIIQAELLPVSSPPAKKVQLLYYWSSSNMIHSTQGSYSGRLLNGLYNEYYLNKSLKVQGVFKKGLKDGIWRNWNESGNLTELYTWDKGVKSGKFELFDAQGKQLQVGEYANNEIVKKDSSSFWKKLNIFKKKKKTNKT